MSIHIVRRIDDLGRVVIPKEIRRTMRIREEKQPQTPLVWCESLEKLANRLDIDYIITRNKKDYIKSSAVVLSPDEFLEVLHKELNQ